MDRSRVDRLESKYFKIAEEGLDIASGKVDKSRLEDMKAKFQASKLGLEIVKNHQVNERVNRSLDLRERMIENDAKRKIIRVQKKIRT